MRISTDQWDVGYAKFSEWGRPSATKVTLDGAVLKQVITADEELGEVKVYDCDDDGRLLLTDDNRGVRTKWLRGRVVIEMPGREP